MSTRREFLTAQPMREAIAHAGAEPTQGACVPLAGNTVRLGKVAMASDFEVILNPGPGALLSAASDALELIDRLEDQMSVFRPSSELSRLNALAAGEAVVVEGQLFDLLRQTVRYAAESQGAFDPTAGPLVSLWRQCRRERRIPTDAELSSARARLGWGDVEFDEAGRTVRFRRSGIELNLNAIGKGYALDRAGELLDDASVARQPPEPLPAPEVETRSQASDTPPDPRSSILDPPSSIPPAWLIHGGHSSILARGSLTGRSGWPISLRHPLFPNRRLATIALSNRGMSTSGSAVQYYRVGNRRYAHLLDPRTGWPAEGMLSATVLAPTAAQAEALSTAFFVLGVEMAREYCHNHTSVAALLVPAPRRGPRLEPVNCGIPESDLIWEPEA
jgi:thiamine biosynthesis lipoprotein